MKWTDEEWTVALGIVRRVVRSALLPVEVRPEDAVAETLLRVVQRRRPNDVRFEAFVYTAARWCRRSFLRSGAGIKRTETEKRKRGAASMVTLLRPDLGALVDPRSGDSVAAVDRADDVSRLRSRLPPRRMRTLDACFLRPLANAKEIGAMLGCRWWMVPYRRQMALRAAAEVLRAPLRPVR